jgi:thiosulfate dehydrogenase [quinone] large subunit
MSTNPTTQTAAPETTFGNVLDFDLQGTLAGYWIVALRVITGYWFLHAGFTKFSFVAGEPFDASGYLLNASASPIAGLFAWVGSTPWMLEFTNVAIPMGEFLIGLGLILGLLTRTAAFFGTFMLFFFYFGAEHWRRGLVNGELLGLVLFVTIVVFGAGRVWGIDSYLETTDLVRNRPWLRYLLG